MQARTIAAGGAIKSDPLPRPAAAPLLDQLDILS